MSQRILVQPGTTGWIWVGRLAGPALLVAGVALFASGAPLGVGLIAGGVMLIAVVEGYAFIKNRGRRWVEDTGEGFVVTDAAGVRPFRDEDVQALSFYTKKNYVSGTHKTTDRIFLVWAGMDPRPIEMRNRISVGQSDPLTGLIDRIVDNHQQRAEEEIDRGAAVHGEGWSLDRSHLKLGHGEAGMPVAIDDLTAVEVYDDRLCVWVRGRDDALARFPVSSRNAHLLHLLLAPQIAERAEQEDGAPAGDGLGRVLFERKANAGTVVVLTLIAIGAVAVAAISALAGAEWYVPLIAVAVGGLCGLGAVGTIKSNFRCHEYGVFQAGFGGEKQMRYAEVGSFSYSATRHYTNGVYTGTQLVMNFTPLPGSTAKAIAYSTSVQAADEALEELRDHISKVIAGRMADELSEGREVAWTQNLTFRPDGLAYRPAGFLGRKEPVMLPWEQFGGFDIQKGVFYLWQKGNDKSVTQEQVSQANFFPGFYLLLSMMSDDEDQAT